MAGRTTGRAVTRSPRDGGDGRAAKQDRAEGGDGRVPPTHPTPGSLPRDPLIPDLPTAEESQCLGRNNPFPSVLKGAKSEGWPPDSLPKSVSTAVASVACRTLSARGTPRRCLPPTRWASGGCGGSAASSSRNLPEAPGRSPKPHEKRLRVSRLPLLLPGGRDPPHRNPRFL